MEKLRCLIVDDEPPAIRLLENFVGKVPFLQLVGTTAHSLEALKMVEAENIDLLFLDIQMPDVTGIQLSRILKGRTRIIFTTAYPQFALESYELNAVDYLLKPIEFERFYGAVLKMKHLVANTVDLSTVDAHLFIKTDGKNRFEKVVLRDIVYIESIKNYVCIHTENRQIITYSTLKHIGESLPKTDFIQIHRSYIIALNHIVKTDSLNVYLHTATLPIGDTYRTTFFKKIQEKGL